MKARLDNFIVRQCYDDWTVNIFVTIILLVIALVVFGTFAYAGWRGAPWVPTRASDVVRFKKIARIKPGQKVYDLGCGDGRLLVAAAELGAQAKGYEVSLFPYLLARLKLLFRRLRPSRNISQNLPGKARVFYRDFWFANLHDADLVYFFLMPKIYPRLKAKLEHELKPGARVIAYVWAIPGWQPTIVDQVPNHPKLFVYEPFTKNP